MQTFSSYGPVDTKQHYYVPRQSLVDQTLAQLVGTDPESGGHYITIWASRQRGKTWIMQQVMQRLQTEPHYAWTDVVKLNLQDLGLLEDVGDVIATMVDNR